MKALATQSEIGIRKSAIADFSLFARDIKLSHTVFAMPFALFAAFLAAGGVPLAGQLVLIVLCMVTARTVAMAANRLLDAELDARNPRTARRAIPSGAVSRSFFVGMVAACALGFVVSTAGFWLFYANPLPLILSVPVLLFISAYPLLKRYTTLCHYYLGSALALAPVCAWIAIAGTVEWPAVWMALAVLLWTAGFDVVYACQDHASDLQTGTFSVPAALGTGGALWVARITHALCIGVLMLLGISTPLLGAIYFTAVALMVVLLIIEHSLVRSNDLSKVGIAFFTINGIISLMLGSAGIIDVFV